MNAIDMHMVPVFIRSTGILINTNPKELARLHCPGYLCATQPYPITRIKCYDMI
jgi:hypothetical protein